jgi:hypothetical protein
MAKERPERPERPLPNCLQQHLFRRGEDPVGGLPLLHGVWGEVTQLGIRSLRSLYCLSHKAFLQAAGRSLGLPPRREVARPG